MSWIRPALQGLIRDEAGVSAAEFALIAPIMILFYLGAAELSGGLMASRRSAHLASTVGDLVAQSDTLTSADISDVFSIGASIMDPMPTGINLEIRVSSVTMAANQQAKVDWSKGQNMSPYAVGDVIGTITTAQLPVGQSLIMTETNYHYTSPVGHLLPGITNFSQTVYNYPRNAGKVTCQAC